MDRKMTKPHAAPLALSDDSLAGITGGCHHPHGHHKHGGGGGAGGKALFAGQSNTTIQNNTAIQIIYAPNATSVTGILAQSNVSGSSNA